MDVDMEARAEAELVDESSAPPQGLSPYFARGKAKPTTDAAATAASESDRSQLRTGQDAVDSHSWQDFRSGVELSNLSGPAPSAEAATATRPTATVMKATSLKMPPLFATNTSVDKLKQFNHQPLPVKGGVRGATASTPAALVMPLVNASVTSSSPALPAAANPSSTVTATSATLTVHVAQETPELSDVNLMSP